MIPGQTAWQTVQIDNILVIADHYKEKKETQRKVRDRKKRNRPKEKKRLVLMRGEEINLFVHLA